MDYERDIFKKREGIQGLQPSSNYEDFKWEEVRPGAWRYLERKNEV